MLRSQAILAGRNRSKGTTAGMRHWYRSIPRCKECKKVYLVEHWRRRQGLCGKCSKGIPYYAIEVQHTALNGAITWHSGCSDMLYFGKRADRYRKMIYCNMDSNYGVMRSQCYHISRLSVIHMQPTGHCNIFENGKYKYLSEDDPRQPHR